MNITEVSLMITLRYVTMAAITLAGVALGAWIVWKTNQNK